MTSFSYSHYLVLYAEPYVIVKRTSVSGHHCITEQVYVEHRVLRSANSTFDDECAFRELSTTKASAMRY